VRRRGLGRREVERRLGRFRKKELLRVKVQLISQLNRNNKFLQLRKPSKTRKSTP
jgi:hypothetical protein